MRVLVLSASPETLVDYLAGAGLEANGWQSNDMVQTAVDRYAPDVAIYDESLEPLVEHSEALRVACASVRVVLVASRDSPLVPVAAALGVRDFVFTPADPAQVLHRVQNPATPEEAAEAVKGVRAKEWGEEQKVEEDGKVERKRVFRGRQENEKRQEEGSVKSAGATEVEKSELDAGFRENLSTSCESGCKGKVVPFPRPNSVTPVPTVLYWVDGIPEELLRELKAKTNKAAAPRKVKNLATETWSIVRVGIWGLLWIIGVWFGLGAASWVALFGAKVFGFSLPGPVGHWAEACARSLELFLAQIVKLLGGG